MEEEKLGEIRAMMPTDGVAPVASELHDTIFAGLRACNEHLDAALRAFHKGDPAAHQRLRDAANASSFALCTALSVGLVAA